MAPIFSVDVSLCFFSLITNSPLPPHPIPRIHLCLLLVVVVGFVALRPKSTAMVIAGRSVHLTTLFPGQA